MERTRRTTTEPTANLARTLIYLAAWRPCSACGARVLYVDSAARTDTTFVCGRCEARREALAKQCRPPRRRPSLPIRVALHLRELFATANDNRGEARP